MYILSTILSGIFLGVFVTYYSRMINWIFSYVDEDLISYSNHPMSDSEGDADIGLHESEEETDDESGLGSDSEELAIDLNEGKKNLTQFTYNSKVITKETPCYMKDFYEETTLSEEWLSKTDSDKREILDKQLDEYKNKNINIDISNALREINC
jgi:hypothetical protein